MFEPGGQIVSDTLTFTDTSGANSFWDFSSDLDGVPLSPLIGTVGILNIIEDGAAQPVVTMTHRNQAGSIIGTDTIQIQSDLEGGVPEPSTWMMALSGLALVGVPVIRRRVVSRR